jgi:hypothetical protein
MKTRVKYAGIGIVALFAAAQLIRPDRANPAGDASRSIEAHVGATNALIPVLNRACADCHSNQTIWPWYTEIAPLSWLMAYAVDEGRKAVNFSDWTGYSPAQRQTLLGQSCRDVVSGTMPSGIYTALNPAARLSARDVETICAASRQPKVTAEYAP